MPSVALDSSPAPESEAAERVFPGKGRHCWEMLVMDGLECECGLMVSWP